MDTPAPPASEALQDRYDAVVVGGGPAGATFALRLRRAGRSVLLVERERHPRFAVGESLLPGTLPLWQELGLEARFEAAGFLRKYGTYFCFGDGAAPEFFPFPRERGHAYDVPRAEFDAILFDAAREAGAHVLEGTPVARVTFDGERATGVVLRAAGGAERTVAASLVADCSGRATLLARQLELREKDPSLDTVALMRHYDDVLRSTGEDAGTVAIIATDFGWMWLIPFADGGASVGAVVRRDAYAEARRAAGDRERVFAQLVESVPAVWRRLRGARATREVEVLADYQYCARRFAGPGWVLVGDAAVFLDPVFSSGVHLAMSGADRAARAALPPLARGRAPGVRDFARYERRMRAATGLFGRFIRAWYDPAFRRVFMRPPPGRPGANLLKREVLAVLAGDVFRPWRVRPAVALLLFLAGLERRRSGAAA